jgi:hypothetical protein
VDSDSRRRCVREKTPNTEHAEGLSVGFTVERKSWSYVRLVGVRFCRRALSTFRLLTIISSTQRQNENSISSVGVPDFYVRTFRLRVRRFSPADFLSLPVSLR